MRNQLKRVMAVVLVVLLICGAAPIGTLAEMDWPALPDGAVSSWFNDGIGAIKSAAVWLGERLQGLALRANAATYSGDCGADGSNVTWNLDTETGVLTISGMGIMKDYSSSPWAPWNSYGASVKTVIISSGVTSIGKYAFYNCSGLTSVTIPDSVTSIGSGAFYNCTGLTNVTIPDSVKDIGRNALLCTSLESITLPFVGLSTDATGEDSLFYAIFGCYSFSVSGTIELNTPYGSLFVWIPSTLKSVSLTKCTFIPDGAFHNCYMLNEIAIPDTVTSIGYDAFSDCTGLTSMTIPDGVTSIGNYAFNNCTGITSMTIPDGVTSIGNSAFNSVFNIVYSGSASGSPWGAKNVNKYVEGFLVFDSAQKAQILRCSRSAIGEVAIPDTVTRINGGAFSSCTGLTNMTIPDSVTRIGGSAFSNCTGLTSVEFNAVNCTEMGSASTPVFSGCAALQTITIGSDVQTIPQYMLYGCSGITELVIPDSVTSIGRSAFYDCTNLASVMLGANVQTIDSNAFSGCTGLTSVTIPDSVTSIGRSAFYDCTNLASVMLGANVQTIDSNAFSGCTGLTSVTIPDSVTSIGSSAFQNCSSLESISLPFIGLSPDAAGADSVFGAIFGYTTSSSYSGTTRQYYGSSSSAYYYIPSSLRSVTVTGEKISAYAFDNCAMLTNITIGEGVSSIGSYAFRGCTGLTTLHFNAVNCTSASALFSGCSALHTITIGNSVSAIPASAFSGCSGITEITIMESVTSIGSAAFNGCTGLERVNYTGTLAQWCDISFANASANPITYSKNLFINNMLVTAPEFQNGVASIGNYTFYNCQSLEQVTLSGVTEIGNSAFYGCTNLAAAILGDSVQTIGNNAFSGCTSLANITIPDSVTSIGDSAFSGCTNLATATLGESVQTIGNNAFSGCTSLANITIPYSVTSIGTSAFSGCTNLAAANLGESVQTIGNSAFYNCTSLTVITVPDSVVSIGNYAFQFCTNLTSATLGTGIQTIGTNAFDGCTALESFALNAEACSAMGTSSEPVFSNCPSLKTVTIGDAATMIPDYAFYNCTSLERVTVGENVRSIGTNAFYNCTALRRVQFRGGKVDIAYDAFDYCGDYALCCSENSYWQAYAIRKGIQYVLVDETSETEFTIENGVLLAYDGTAAKITLPSCVTLVDYEAFRGNEVITRVAMSDSVTQISNYAFADCRNLAEVFIPDTVTSIGTNAFFGSHPTIICIENSYAHRFATAHNMSVKFVRILIDLENAVMRVEIPYDDEPEVSLVHLTGVSLQVIGLGSMPAKTSYRVGEKLDTNGLSLEAHYTNGMTSVLRDGFSVSQPIFSEPGEQTVTLDYCGQTVEFTVTVTNEVVSGDADRSGTLDLKDIALVTRSLAGGWDVDLTDVDVDVNKDGEVNLKDTVLLRRYLAGGWGVQLA